MYYTLDNMLLIAHILAQLLQDTGVRAQLKASVSECIAITRDTVAVYTAVVFCSAS